MADVRFDFSTNIAGVVAEVAANLDRLNQALNEAGKGSRAQIGQQVVEQLTKLEEEIAARGPAIQRQLQEALSTGSAATPVRGFVAPFKQQAAEVEQVMASLARTIPTSLRRAVGEDALRGVLARPLETLKAQTREFQAELQRLQGGSITSAQKGQFTSIDRVISQAAEKWAGSALPKFDPTARFDLRAFAEKAGKQFDGLAASVEQVQRDVQAMQGPVQKAGDAQRRLAAATDAQAAQVEQQTAQIKEQRARDPRTGRFLPRDQARPQTESTSTAPAVGDRKVQFVSGEGLAVQERVRSADTRTAAAAERRQREMEGSAREAAAQRQLQERLRQALVDQRAVTVPSMGGLLYQNQYYAGSFRRGFTPSVDPLANQQARRLVETQQNQRADTLLARETRAQASATTAAERTATAASRRQTTMETAAREAQAARETEARLQRGLTAGTAMNVPGGRNILAQNQLYRPRTGGGYELDTSSPLAVQQARLRVDAQQQRLASATPADERRLAEATAQLAADRQRESIIATRLAQVEQRAGDATAGSSQEAETLRRALATAAARTRASEELFGLAAAPGGGRGGRPPTPPPSPTPPGPDDPDEQRRLSEHVFGQAFAQQPDLRGLAAANATMRNSAGQLEPAFRQFGQYVQLGADVFLRTASGLRPIGPASEEMYRAMTALAGQLRREEADQRRQTADQQRGNRTVGQAIVQGFFGHGYGQQNGQIQNAQQAIANVAGTAAVVGRYQIGNQILFAGTSQLGQIWQDALRYEDTLVDLNTAAEAANARQVDLNESFQAGAGAGLDAADSMQIATEALSTYSQAIRDGSDANEVMARSTKAVATNVLLTGQTADVAQRQLNAINRGFGLDQIENRLPGSFAQLPNGAEGMARANDAIINAAKNFGGSKADISDAVARAAAPAKLAGLNVEETANIAALIGSQTGNTGGQIAAEIERLAAKSGTGPFQQLLARFQIENTGQVLPEAQALSREYKKLSPEGRQQMISSMGGYRSLEGTLSLMERADELPDANSRSYEKMGRAAEEAAKHLDTLAGRIRRIATDFSNMAMQIGQSGIFAPIKVLLAGLDPAIHLVNDFVSAWNKLPGVLRNVVLGAGEVALVLRLIQRVGLGGVGAGAARAGQNALSVATLGAVPWRGGGGGGGGGGGPTPPEPPTGPTGPRGPVVSPIAPARTILPGERPQMEQRSAPLPRPVTVPANDWRSFYSSAPIVTPVGMGPMFGRPGARTVQPIRPEGIGPQFARDAALIETETDALAANTAAKETNAAASQALNRSLVGGGPLRTANAARLAEADILATGGRFAARPISFATSQAAGAARTGPLSPAVRAEADAREAARQAANRAAMGSTPVLLDHPRRVPEGIRDYSQPDPTRNIPRRGIDLDHPSRPAQVIPTPINPHAMQAGQEVSLSAQARARTNAAAAAEEAAAIGTDAEAKAADTAATEANSAAQVENAAARRAAIEQEAAGRAARVTRLRGMLEREAREPSGVAAPPYVAQGTPVGTPPVLGVPREAYHVPDNRAIRSAQLGMSQAEVQEASGRRANTAATEADARAAEADAAAKRVDTEATEANSAAQVENAAARRAAAEGSALGRGVPVIPPVIPPVMPVREVPAITSARIADVTRSVPVLAAEASAMDTAAAATSRHTEAATRDAEATSAEGGAAERTAAAQEAAAAGLNERTAATTRAAAATGELAALTGMLNRQSIEGGLVGGLGAGGRGGIPRVNLLNPGRFPEGERLGALGAAERGAGGLGRGFNALGGWAMVGIVGAMFTNEVRRAADAQDKALRQASEAQNASGTADSVEALHQSASDLKNSVDALNSADKGVTGTLARWLGGDQTSQAIATNNQLAEAATTTAQRISDARANVGSTEGDVAGAVDILHGPDALSASLKNLSDQGRSAATVMDGLIEAMDKTADAAAKGTRYIAPGGVPVFAAELSDKVGRQNIINLAAGFDTSARGSDILSPFSGDNVQFLGDPNAYDSWLGKHILAPVAHHLPNQVSGLARLGGRVSSAFADFAGGTLGRIPSPVAGGIPRWLQSHVGGGGNPWQDLFGGGSNAPGVYNNDDEVRARILKQIDVNGLNSGLNTDFSNYLNGQGFTGGGELSQQNIDELKRLGRARTQNVIDTLSPDDRKKLGDDAINQMLSGVDTSVDQYAKTANLSDENKMTPESRAAASQWVLQNADQVGTSRAQADLLAATQPPPTGPTHPGHYEGSSPPGTLLGLGRQALGLPATPAYDPTDPAQAASRTGLSEQSNAFALERLISFRASAVKNGATDYELQQFDEQINAHKIQAAALRAQGIQGEYGVRTAMVSPFNQTERLRLTGEGLAKSIRVPGLDPETVRQLTQQRLENQWSQQSNWFDTQQQRDLSKVGVGDSVGEAGAAAADARRRQYLLWGQSDEATRIQMTRTTRQTAADEGRAKMERENARLDTLVDPRDTLGAATKAVGDDRRYLAELKQYEPGNLTDRYKAERKLAEDLLEEDKARVAAARNASLLRLDMTNPLQMAQQDLRDAIDKYNRDARDPKLTGAARTRVLNEDLIDQRNKQAATDAQAFQQDLATHQYAYDMGEESHAAFLRWMQQRKASIDAQLAGMKVTDQGYQQLTDQSRQLGTSIKGLEDSLSGTQFNIGDIRMPTVYEMRRTLTAGNQNMGYTDNRNVTITVNGGNPDEVLSVIKSQLGTSAMNRRAPTTARRV